MFVIMFQEHSLYVLKLFMYCHQNIVDALRTFVSPTSKHMFMFLEHSRKYYERGLASTFPMIKNCVFRHVIVPKLRPSCIENIEDIRIDLKVPPMPPTLKTC